MPLQLDQEVIGEEELFEKIDLGERTGKAEIPKPPSEAKEPRVPKEEPLGRRGLFEKISGLEEFEELLEDIEDLAVLAERREEPTVTHAEVLAQLKRDGIL